MPRHPTPVRNLQDAAILFAVEIENEDEDENDDQAEVDDESSEDEDAPRLEVEQPENDD